MGSADVVWTGNISKFCKQDFTEEVTLVYTAFLPLHLLELAHSPGGCHCVSSHSHTHASPFLLQKLIKGNKDNKVVTEKHKY